MKLRLHILQALRSMGEHLCPEPTLRVQIQVTASPTPTTVEITEALVALRDADLAIDIRDELTGDVKWAITDKGRLKLSERRM